MLFLRKLKFVTAAAIFAGAAFSQVSPTNITVDGPFQVRYASNLNLGTPADSVVNITNSGARDAGFAAGTSASTTSF